MYGLASAKKRYILEEYGAIPIDYRTQDFIKVLKEAEPEGIDFVFNGMGEEVLERGLKVLRRGGCLVHYGGPRSNARFFFFLVKFLWYNLLPNGKSIKGYGTHRGAVDSFKEDWAILFKLLEEGKIKPIISHTMPIKDAVKANQLFESGDFTGHIVLVAVEEW
jgi:NADPH:quinone reductase-like Zn-dependent oxidoreductase